MKPQPASVDAFVAVSAEGSDLAPCLYSLCLAGWMIIVNPPQQPHTIVAYIGAFGGLDFGIFICEASTSVSEDVCTPFSDLGSCIEDTVPTVGAKGDRLQLPQDSILRHVESQEVVC